ncbi:hypothetical protein [Mycobacterium sp. TY815]|uniref:hypothetical protein n=1 Tax=Mycobacterium sp. TY815 TaxID=3050581 RepID=UPI002740D6C1|nr:hypothetical protein [Mycobacterium sp. TY815]MDP7705386.1 hypothetical protein [Mycobacterium sp. TY815]
MSNGKEAVAGGETVRVNLPLAAIALSSGTLIAISPAAGAEVPATEGVYAYMEGPVPAGTWTIRTTCTPQCVAHVTTSPGHGFSAPLVDGRHLVTRTVPDGVTCPLYFLGDNGSSWGGGAHPVTVRQWWDPATLEGGVDFLSSPAPCGIPNPRNSFTLVRVG